MGPDRVGKVPGPTALPAHGVEIACRDDGDGPAVLLLHETGGSALVWDRLHEELAGAARVISYDRRGWGDTGAPEGYARTTVEEHAEDAVAVLDALGVEDAVVAGAGVGGVAALDLALRRPGLVRAGVLVEPPLLALLPQATEGMSADRETIEGAVRDGGPEAALDAYLAGALPFLGPGAGRIPDEAAAPARRRPLSLFAELAAVPSWALQGRALSTAEVPILIVTGASTPPLLREAGAALAARLPESRSLTVGGSGLPHIDAAPELAAELRSLLAA
ncbi:MAG TPA: alpha/beta fold hydrolase [Solirubrobacterales bacterium]|nr:alpha/beta fold hydrolase [Solirubrobacterales bacterium]